MLWGSIKNRHGDSNRNSQHMILWRNTKQYRFNSNPLFPLFLLYIRCKLGVTFGRRYSHDVTIKLFLIYIQSENNRKEKDESYCTASDKNYLSLTLNALAMKNRAARGNILKFGELGESIQAVNTNPNWSKLRKKLSSLSVCCSLLVSV